MRLTKRNLEEWKSKSYSKYKWNWMCGKEGQRSHFCLNHVWSYEPLLYNGHSGEFRWHWDKCQTPGDPRYTERTVVWRRGCTLLIQLVWVGEACSVWLIHLQGVGNMVDLPPSLYKRYRGSSWERGFLEGIAQKRDLFDNRSWEDGFTKEISITWVGVTAPYKKLINCW